MGYNLLNAGYNKVAESSGEKFKKLEAGGYVCKILHAYIDEVDKDGRKFLKGPLLRCEVDICEGEFSGYFRKSYDRFHKDHWDDAATFGRYVFNGQEVSAGLKGLLECVRRSNPNCNINLGDFSADALNGKICGFIFTDESYTDRQGELKYIVRIAFPIDAERVRTGDYTMPKSKDAPPPKSPPKKSEDKHFGTTEEIDEDNIPF